jgi:hypothetical protein
MNTKTLLANSIPHIEDQLQQHLTGGFKPTLAIVFSSITFDLDAVRATFDRHDIDVFGCSTAGEILNEEVHDSVIAALLLDIDRKYYGIHFGEYEGKGPFLTGKEAGAFSKSHFSNPAILVNSGGVTIDAEQIVFGLKSGAGGEVPIFGGLAADDLGFKRTYAFSRHGITDNGLVVLTFDNDRVEIKGLATSGWEGVGMENTITRAEGNIVYTINDEPALDVFIKYFGYFDNSEVKGKALSTISAQYPLQILRDDGTTVLRSPLVGKHDDRTLILAGGVRQGDKFRFSISPGFEVIEKTIDDFGYLRQNTDQADALILFSCKGRHAALGPLIEDEIKGIYDFWRKPMIGFFTYGEIGPTKKGICEFHNETCSLVVLKEKV